MIGIQIGPVLRQYIVVIIANFSILHLGLNAAWSSPVLVMLRSQNQTVLPHPVTDEEGAWISSIGSLLAACVFFIPGYLGDKIGRKTCIVLASVPKLAIGLLYTFASEVWMLLLGRALFGISDIFIITLAVTYASEISSSEIRGALGTLTQILLSTGMLITLSIGPFVSYLSFNIIMTTIMTLTTIPLFFLPESPYFLYSKGRIDESVKVLTFLRGTEALAREEIKEYCASNKEIVKKRELLKDRTFLKSLGMSIFLGIQLQMIGYNAVSFYLQTIFESAQTNVSPAISSVIIGCLQIFAGLCTISVTDRFGRKPILTSSLFGMAIGMIGLGVFFKMTENQQEVSGILNYLPLVSLMLVIYCHNLGMGSLVMVLISELFDGPSRAFGVSISIVISTLFIFITTRFFGAVTNTIGAAPTYWIFGANCVITSLFIMLLVPETKGKTFAEIQRALGLTDRFGRKPILTSSLFGMAIGMIGLGVFFKMTENQQEVSGILNYLPLVSLMLVIYCHNLGMGSLVMVLISELFDGPSRAFGVSISIVISTLFIFITTRFFGAVTNTIGAAPTYWIFGANCVITSLFIMLLVPETKGKTFAEIQRALGRKL